MDKKTYFNTRFEHASFAVTSCNTDGSNKSTSISIRTLATIYFTSGKK